MKEQKTTMISIEQINQELKIIESQITEDKTKEEIRMWAILYLKLKEYRDTIQEYKYLEYFKSE